MTSQHGDRHRPGAGDVAGCVLGRRPNVEDEHLAALEARRQLLVVDDVYAVALPQVRAGQTLQTRDMLGGHVAQRRPQLADPLARQRVEGTSPVAPGGEQPGAGHGPQVVRRVGHALADLLRQLVHRSLALGEHVNDLGSTAARQRLGYLGEGVEQRFFGRSLIH